ncbi:MAG: hypothetical protein WB995_17155 [Candidatus Acidiferrales bacterium]
MRVALLITFAASKKEPLVAMMDRVHQAFIDAGLGEPAIRFTLADAMVGGSVSSVDRVLKRHPELERFVTTAVQMPQIPGARRISNAPSSPAAGEAVAYATLQAIAAGVPRSYPFHSVSIHFHSPAFGDLAAVSLNVAETIAGVLLCDSWWVNGRNRSLSACRMVEAEPGSKKLPSPPSEVAAVLAACGKVRRTAQVPLPAPNVVTSAPRVRMPGEAGAVASANPEAAHAVRAIVMDCRARLKEVVERAALPHELPGSEAWRGVDLGTTSGPRKPALERTFKPLGYDCRGESGTFTLRRRTPANLTVELRLDVGTWGHNVLAMFMVWGLGFKATLMLPVSANDLAGGQYPIGDADRWQKIVENLGALVAELDRSFVPEIEAAAGPSPEWYQPEK